MKINSNIKIAGEKVILVPYTELHVPRYHEWMKSEELQQLTASEPLSLAEEYEMQKSWREDDDKCTFIILDKEVFENTHNEIGSMIGDTNIFVTDKTQAQGEIEIMIAEKSDRGKKMGWEAVILMLLYGIEYVNLKKYEAKISLSNEKSLKMFNKLGFEEVSRSNVFQEITLHKVISTEWTTWLKELCKYNIAKYC
ncbi:N-acetyltransferase 9 [Zerene cesonia]|uniref:N-acetyltransferase 9 n=1 Tax=Zerene cesonia TaxID=33412 RepID=UPI0018E52847|nr:N-acetyltransferase 9 [Zerene cesonia]XP_038208688.1 N-acetyltransferase 9 [Zerene cesonia]